MVISTVFILTFGLLLPASHSGLTPWLASAAKSPEKPEHAPRVLQDGGHHSSNWAVIIDTSRFWFNYRHASNALSVYHAVKRLGIPDDHIILMLAGQPSCDPRNSFPGQIFYKRDHEVNIYDTTIEVDYRGLEVTVENFLQVLTGRHSHDVPRSKRMDTDDGSNILVYMTGHGGDEFLKFQDTHEVSTTDLEEAFQEMNSKGRYNEIMFMADTCQAATLMSSLKAPRMVTIGSSKLDESSYSYVNDREVGVSLIDRFTLQAINFFHRDVTLRRDGTSSKSLRDLFSTFEPSFLRSNPEWTVRLGKKTPSDIPVTDFFGSLNQVLATKSVGYQMGKANRTGGIDQPQNTGEAKMEEDHASTKSERIATDLPNRPLVFSSPFYGLSAVTFCLFVISITLS